ncbi:MAG: LPS export ABC transporter periplasmic protein LptC [Rhodocyclaceae bacterium]|nr:LPS export ABC transporter periplasmic protein LptC [Rhodocyclaceae bacterium]
MRPTGASLFPIVLLALLAGMTFWLERATRTGDLHSGKERHDPDFIVDRFEVRRYDTDGALQHTLIADRMLHYADDESSDVIAPHLTYHRQRPTVVTSRTAWMDKDAEHARLDGDVRIVRAGADGGPETVITTSVLHVIPDDEFAHTDAPVTLTQGQSVIHGVGLTTDNKTQISTLFGPVRGIIHRTQNQ